MYMVLWFVACTLVMLSLSHRHKVILRLLETIKWPCLPSGRCSLLLMLAFPRILIGSQSHGILYIKRGWLVVFFSVFKASMSVSFLPNVLVLFALILIKLPKSSQISCPAFYEDQFGVCVNSSKDVMTYCDAQDYCLRINGELVTKQRALALQRKLFRSQYWIGLTDLLEERKKSRTRWRWTDSSLSDESLLQWNVNEPGNLPNCDCVLLLINGRLGDQLCDTGNPSGGRALCQPQRRKFPADAIFSKVLTFSSIKKSEEDARGACWERVYVTSKLACAALCSTEYSEKCVGIYFNVGEGQCILLFYTDANIHIGGDTRWNKYMRQT